MARVQNSHLLVQNQRLVPLVNPMTNALIEGFPARSRDIPTMEDQTLDSVLDELELCTNGGREVKENRFRQYIGLVPYGIMEGAVELPGWRRV